MAQFESIVCVFSLLFGKYFLSLHLTMINVTKNECKINSKIEKELCGSSKFPVAQMRRTSQMKTLF